MMQILSCNIKRISILTIALSLMVILFYSNRALSANKTISPSDIKHEMLSNIELQQKVKKLGDKWAQKRAMLLQQIQQLKSQKIWLDYQIKLYKAYINEEHQTIAELKRRQKILEQINIKLEPYLGQVVTRLSNFIKHDMPFLQQERATRLDFLKQSLVNYKIGLGEKLRRVLQALEIEAKYGMQINTREDEITLNGQKLDGYILRLGRLDMFFVSLNRQIAAKYNKKLNRWVKISDEYIDDIEQTIQISQKKRAAQIVDLPIGRLTK